MKLDIDKRNIVVIGASAGGVQALTALFGSLPADLAASVLVVMHIPPHTPSALHRIISKATGMNVVAATDKEPLNESTVYVATADRHLMVDDAGIRVTRGPKECRARPAVDVLFRSASAAYGPRVIGVVLTGALDDGTAGLWAIKDRDGLAFVQDPLEAMQASMPENAIKHVEVDFVGSIEALAREISNAVGATVGNQSSTFPRHWHAVENTISVDGNGMAAGVMNLGKVSKYTCPDCHGVLVQIDEGSIIRFRCHTGHAFSMKTLVAEVNEAIDTGLWSTLRAIEERVMLLRQMADVSENCGSKQEAADCRRQADEAEQRLQPLRELVLDPHFFGHDPAA